MPFGMPKKMFQSPISGVNDWNQLLYQHGHRRRPRFSLLLAELMIGTQKGELLPRRQLEFQSPISGVNDWNAHAGSI